MSEFEPKRRLWLCRLFVAVVVVALGVAGVPYLLERDALSALPTGAVVDRKHAVDLTPLERAEFVEAVRSLQTAPAPDDPEITWYEQFVQWHLEGARCENAHGNSGAIHFSPVFLPWHREFLLKFEAALQEVSGNPNLRIPYWDFTDPASSAAVFSADFMGGMGDPSQDNAVTTGPFARGPYELRVFEPPELGGPPGKPYLTRNPGSPPVLPAEQVENVMRAEHFDVAPFDATADPNASFRNAIEGWRGANGRPDCSDGWISTAEVMGEPDLSVGSPMVGHNMVHALVGGAAIAQTSPNDPVFWLLHANIDRLWSIWQQTHPDGFPAQAAGWTPDSTMWPWFDTPIENFDSIEANGYRYAN